jgi:hypothetical protein
MEWSWCSFLIGLFIGANVGLFMIALLKNSTQDIEDE